MKLQHHIHQRLCYFCAAVCILLLPALSFSQTGPPGPTDTEPPSDVPFDSTMNLVFVIMGVLFAAFIIYQEVKRRRLLEGK